MDTSISLVILCLINFVSPDVAAGGGEMEGLGLGGPYPYNVTINHLSSRSVEVIWDCKSQNLHDKYEVTLKPLEARVIETVPYNTCYLLMDKLEANTNYQVSVTSVTGRVRKRSSSVIFRTFIEDYRDEEDGGGSTEEDEAMKGKERLKVPRVRFVEISLVCMALFLWAGAILLFFNRWGKIRMLLPPQPAYKELKRNNSVVCINCSMTPHHQCCKVHQPLQYQAECDAQQGQSTSCQQLPTKEEPGSGPLVDMGCSHIRPRLHSFITFDLEDPELIRGRIWRKSKSAEELGYYSCPLDQSTPSTDF